MRFSQVASGALCSAAAVSALTVPSRVSRRGAVGDLMDGVMDDIAEGLKDMTEQVGDVVGDLVDLTDFKANSFHVIPLGDAQNQAKDKWAANPESWKNMTEIVKDIFDPVQDPTNDIGSDIRKGATMAEGATGSCSNPAVRPEWRSMSEDARTSFISAVKCLFDKPSAGGFGPSGSRYEDMVYVHQQMVNQVHMVGQFLMWHRGFLAVYQSLLQDECGYSGPLPWWDERIDAGNFRNAPLFTSQWFGNAAAETSSNQGTCVSSGPLAGITLSVGPGSSETKHCISRAVDESLSAQDNAGYTDTCQGYSAFEDFSSCLETGPHAYGHNSMGGVMEDVASSPGDPIFFMHHAFIDRNYRVWENEDASRLTAIGGFSDQAKTTPLTSSYVLNYMGLYDSTTVASVLDTQGGFLCYKYDY